MCVSTERKVTRNDKREKTDGRTEIKKSGSGEIYLEQRSQERDISKLYNILCIFK